MNSQLNKVRKVRSYPEASLMASCIKWFRYQYPSELIIHIPNEGKRSAFFAKQMGIVAGVPDLFVAVPNKYYHGLFIELKAGSGKPSEKQLKFISHLNRKQYKALVVNNISDFISLINGYFNE